MIALTDNDVIAFLSKWRRIGILVDSLPRIRRTNMDQKEIPASETEVTKLLTECLRIHAERHAEYGPSEKQFVDVADLASALSPDGKKYCALDVAVLMIAIKEVRYKRFAKKLNSADCTTADAEGVRDSVVDLINYIAIMENVRCNAIDTKK